MPALTSPLRDSRQAELYGCGTVTFPGSLSAQRLHLGCKAARLLPRAGPPTCPALSGCPRPARSEASILGSAQCPAPSPVAGKLSQRARGPGCSPSVIKKICMGGVRLLAPQKPVNRPGWWKGKFALFQIPETGREGGRHVSKGQMTSRG